eukprot:scaffold50569_cov33-Tisochrysis_lutea.AAC.4
MDCAPAAGGGARRSTTGRDAPVAGSSVPTPLATHEAPQLVAARGCRLPPSRPCRRASMDCAVNVKK